jgi:hypothetical protein
MDHYAKTAESLKDSHGLLEATGLFDTQARVANSKREEYVTQDVVSPSRIHALRQELERKVTRKSNPNSVIRLRRERPG